MLGKGAGFLQLARAKVRGDAACWEGVLGKGRWEIAAAGGLCNSAQVRRWDAACWEGVLGKRR